jgi:hypothetical protein
VLADEIVRELCRHVIPSAVSAVKSRIRTLRKAVQQAETMRRPSEANKTIAQIAKHAEAIAAGIDKLDDNRRWYLLLVLFGERNWHGALRAGYNEDQLRSRMTQWLSELRKARNFSPSKPKDLCAIAAREIIFELASSALVTKGDGSKFYRTASLLWEAVTGEREKSLKRACDYQIDFDHGIPHGQAASAHLALSW